MTEADESKVTRPTAEAGAVEPVAWCSVEEGEVVALSFKENEASDCVEPLYSRHAIDTLRAQLEAAEAEWREKFEARTIDWSEASNALYVWRHRAKDAEVRAEAAEADAARYQLLKVWGRQMSIEGTGECNFGITTPTWRGPWIDLDAAIDAAIARTKEQQA